MPTRGNAWKSGVRAEARPGVAALPERRVGGQREQQRQVAAHPVHQVDRGVGVGDAHVHVEREGGLPARELPHRVVHALVARAGGHANLLPDRERMGAARRGAQARACRAAPRAPRAGPRARPSTPGTFLCTRERSSSADLWVSAVTCDPSSGASAGSTRSISCASDHAPRVDHHDLLLDPERVVGRGALGRPPGPGGEAHAARAAGRDAYVLRRLDQAREQAHLLGALDQALGVPLHAEDEVAAGCLDRLHHAVRRPADGQQAATEPVDRLVVERVDHQVRAPEHVRGRARRRPARPRG